ncbi:hypothetical protein ZWY2020_023902 [Hordeum vulgare]|nr:hypothetical protein ZWY2020_023902 [Hordeum vulgare]
MMAGEDGYSSEELSQDEQEQEAAADAAAEASWHGIVARARARLRSRLGAIPKGRVQDEDVIFILSLERDGVDYLDGQGHRRYTPDKAKEMIDMLLKDDHPDDEIEERQARVMRELSDKGYAESHNYRVTDDDEYIDEINEWTSIQWERIQAASARRRRLARSRVAVKDHHEQDCYSEEEEEDYRELGEEEEEEEIIQQAY